MFFSILWYNVCRLNSHRVFTNLAKIFIKTLFKKRKKKIKYQIFLLTAFLLSMVVFGFGQAPTALAQTCPSADEGLPGDFMSFTRSIVPCGRNCDDADSEYDETQSCTLCHLIVMIHNIFNLMLALLIIVALLFITLGGVLFIVSAGNPGLRTTAKGIITRTLLGFALFLLAWLIVYGVLVFMSANENMLGIVNQGGSWFEFECSVESAFGN